MSAWTLEENVAVSKLYCQMFSKAALGEKYNKAAMIREAQGNDVPGEAGPLIDRSKGAVEAKLMNCTAAHRDLMPGAITMDGFGYRALSNYQAALKVAMREELARWRVVLDT